MMQPVWLNNINQKTSFQCPIIFKAPIFNALECIIYWRCSNTLLQAQKDVRPPSHPRPTMKDPRSRALYGLDQLLLSPLLYSRRSVPDQVWLATIDRSMTTDRRRHASAAAQPSTALTSATLAVMAFFSVASAASPDPAPPPGPTVASRKCMHCWLAAWQTHGLAFLFWDSSGSLGSC
jgi:hypothetical protein